MLIYYAVKPGDIAPAFVLYFVFSFVVDLHAPLFWSAIAETIDYGRVKTGKRVSGIGYRVSGFALGGISVRQKAGRADRHCADAVHDFGFLPPWHGLLMFKYRISDAYYGAVKADMKFRGYVASWTMQKLAPLIEQRADPSIYRHTDGHCYFTASVPEYKRVELRGARTIAELATEKSVNVWHRL